MIITFSTHFYPDKPLIFTRLCFGRNKSSKHQKFNQISGIVCKVHGPDRTEWVVSLTDFLFQSVCCFLQIEFLPLLFIILQLSLQASNFLYFLGVLTKPKTQSIIAESHMHTDSVSGQATVLFASLQVGRERAFSSRF